MYRIFSFPTRAVGLAMLMLALATMPAQAQSSSGEAASDKDEGQDTSIERVEAKHTCMITNRLYEKVQIPVPIGEKTYYGCCRGCVTELKSKPESRTATDPVTGEDVDKATAVIGALPDGTVRYFKSEKTMRRFTPSDDTDS